jgi:hypothetical protein
LSTPLNNPMPHLGSEPDATDCLFATILGFMLPFYLAGAGGNVDVARAAIVELIEAYGAATAAELDLVGRQIGFSAAAMDNLRLSMRAGLSDTKVLQYRGNAVALSRSAEQCRKVLEVMQSKRDQQRGQAAKAQSLPEPEPPVTSPPIVPVPEWSPGWIASSMVDGDPEFCIDIAAMKRDAHAMLADLQARAYDLGPEAPDASIAQMDRSHVSHGMIAGRSA